MREIKFRAWDGKKFINESGTSEYGIDIFSGELFSAYTDSCESPVVWRDNCVLQQFTGLTDKNGKEIYEGDWCTAKFRTKDGIQVVQGRIIMDEFMWCIDCTGCVGDDIFSINRLHDFEIIGNIYENPELLN